MRSEKVLFLRHIVVILAVSSSVSWIYPGVQALLKFSPINEITLGTEVTIDWQGQPSLGNIEQAVVLMKDGNALLTLCEGQITGSGQCSFELKPEHQVLGDGYQLAMQGKDGLALDYSDEFSIKSAEVKAEEASLGSEAEGEEKDEDEIEIEEESKEDEDEVEDRVHGDDEEVDMESAEHNDEHGDDRDDREEDNDKADEDEEEEARKKEDKKKKDKKHKQKHHSTQKSEEIDKKPAEDQHHHHDKEQQKKKKQQQLKEDNHYQKETNRQLKKLLQQHRKQQQQWFTVPSATSPQQRAKEAARLLEKNRRRRQMMLTATRQKYLRLRQEALSLQLSIKSVLDQFVPASAQAAELPKVKKVEAAIKNIIGIQPVVGNDAHVELMPERPVVEAIVAGDMDEMDVELADEQDPSVLLPSKQDDDSQEYLMEKRDDDNADVLMEKMDKRDDTNAKNKNYQEPSSIWDQLWGGIAVIGKTVGTTVANGLTLIKQTIIGGGADAPGGEL
ncbi:hypothetical protein EC991_010328 [Linnemannia zychae]|nr:hypothetical protein EC991_010328 [Linnemannia zychae]